MAAKKTKLEHRFFPFQILLSDGGQIDIAAETENERETWLQCLRNDEVRLNLHCCQGKSIGSHASLLVGLLVKLTFDVPPGARVGLLVLVCV